MTTGIVIAGGESTRFGSTDKALATVGDTPMIRRVVDGLVPVVDRIVVNVREEQRSPIAAALSSAPRPIQFAIDRHTDGGPVDGLETALGAVDDEIALVLACDLPLVRTATLHALYARLERSLDTGSFDRRSPDCLFPLVDGRAQPLCGAYVVEPLRSAIGTLEDTCNRSFHAVLDRVNVATIHRDRLPGGFYAFENVNTRADLEAVRAVVRDDGRTSESDPIGRLGQDG